MSSAEPDDERTLLNRVRSGDVEAEGVLYVAYVDVAVRRALQLGAQRADAEDFVAEAFIRVLRQLRKGQGPDGRFRPYLWASLRSVAADAYRGQRGRERPSEELTVMRDFSSGSDPQNEIDVCHAVRAAMRTLPLRWREVLWSLDVEGRSPADLAAELGATAQSISAVAYRARKALRRAYHEANPGGLGDQIRSSGNAAHRSRDRKVPRERELLRLVPTRHAEAQTCPMADLPAPTVSPAILSA